MLQVATGIALATVYVPSSGQAYESLKFISEQALLGRFLRGMHYFGASAMVLLIGIHVSRTYLMAAYKFPRELNWLTGAVLLLLTLALAFTGQLLRWDQTAVLVGHRRRRAGGAHAGGRARDRALHPRGRHHRRRHAEPLLRLPRLLHPGDACSPSSALHLVAGPAARHLGARPSRRRGGSRDLPGPLRRAAPARGRTVLAGRRVARRRLRRGGGRDASCCWRSSSGRLQLGKPPDPSILEAYPRPDWYFLWYFAVLALAPHHLETIIIVAGPLLFGAALLLPAFFNKGYRSVRRRPWAALLVVFMWMTIVSFWVAGERADWSPDFTARAATGLDRAQRPAGGRRRRPTLPRQGVRVLPRDRGLRWTPGSRVDRGTQQDDARTRSPRGSPTAAPTCPPTPAPSRRPRCGRWWPFSRRAGRDARVAAVTR